MELTKKQKQASEEYQKTFDCDGGDCDGCQIGESRCDSCKAWDYIEEILERNKKGQTTAQDVEDAIFYLNWVEEYATE